MHLSVSTDAEGHLGKAYIYTLQTKNESADLSPWLARRSPFLRERGKKSQDGDLLGSCLTPTHKNGNVRTEQADRAHKLPVCDQLPTSVLWCFGGRERGKHIFSCVRLLVKRSLLHFSRENRDRAQHFLLEPRDEIPKLWPNAYPGRVKYAPAARLILRQLQGTNGRQMKSLGKREFIVR